MIARDKLASYLHNYLECSMVNDYAPNGLQIEGRESIHRICTAVTASQSVIDNAVALKADALLVHHGYFWRGEEAVITGMKRQRIGKLMEHNINLFAYHLPLDCHPVIGNNACFAQLLEVQTIERHVAGKTVNLLWSGQLSSSFSAKTFSTMLHHKLGRLPLHVGKHDTPIHSIAWCTGAAQDFIVEAHQLGVDAYLSGEVSERTYYQAEELGLHYFACGHHATERYGIQALGRHLSEQLSLEHQFIDSDNPV